jgi:hypothetical protein
MLSIVTFGVVPGFLPAGMYFGYDLEIGGTSQPIVHRLPLYERFSLWDRLAARDRDEVIGEALKYSTPETPNKAPEPTSRAVTPRADARVAPSQAVAHL